MFPVNDNHGNLTQNVSIRIFGEQWVENRQF